MNRYYYKSNLKAGLRVLLTVLALVVATMLKAQAPDSAVYPIVVQFNSECCGVPGYAPLGDCIRSFKKKNKLKEISAVRIGPMGREGEYWLAFSLKELNRKQALLFCSQVKAVTGKLKGPGSASFVEKMKIVTSELPARATIKKIML